jgi:hypothetical protein
VEVYMRGMLFKVLGAGAAASLMTAGVALAAPPTAEEINKVYDYLDNGKDSGPVLLELVPCLKVDKKVPEGTDTKSAEYKNAKKTCVDPITGPINKKTEVTAWMRFFVPKGSKITEEDLKVVFKGQEDLETKPLAIDLEGGSSGYGVMKTKTLKSAGEWEIIVKYKDAVMGSTKVTVTK